MMLERTAQEPPAIHPEPSLPEPNLPEPSPPQPSRRKNDPEATRRNIIDVALEEFAAQGYSGARVDEIAAKTRTSKRMIYYYFGGKEQLYLAVLEEAYRSIRELEESLDTENCSAVEAVRRLIEATFEHDERNPNFIRLVSIENIHRAKHLKHSAPLREINASVIATLSRILERGHAEGVFRRDIDPIDLHLAISSFCFFRVANQYTFGALFNRDLSEPAVRQRNKRQIADMVLAYLAGEQGATATATTSATAAPAPVASQLRVLTGLIGAPIKHSASPAMHEAAAAAVGLRGHYQLIEVAGADRAQLRGLLEGVRHMGFAGVNVTYPYKEAVVEFLDELAPEAQAMGAVNTVVVRGNRLIGHNTDATGFARAAAPLVDASDRGPVALIGAGGVGKAIAFALVSLGVNELRIVDANSAKAETLAALLRHDATVSVTDNIEAALRGAVGLVNGTPVGMLPNRDSPVPEGLLHGGLWVADAIYSPLWTPLLNAAKARGARVMTGRELAIHQAADAFRLFTGLPAPVEAMAQAFDGVMAKRYGTA
jgi:shikimate dehydrogenase